MVEDLSAGAVLLSLVRGVTQFGTQASVVATCRPTHYESQAERVDRSSLVYGGSQTVRADGRTRTLALLEL